jgi:hypothetical protein
METDMAKTDPDKEETDRSFKVDPVENEATATPINVGNPMDAASLAIDQSHLEEFASVEEKSDHVRCDKPPKGIYFTVRAEKTKQWKDRGFYYMLQIEGRDPYLVAPHIAKLKKDEDVIRPILIVRYVTMAGEEGLWPLKLDQPDGKTNNWNKSAQKVLELAESKWVRLISGKGHYNYMVSRRTFEQTPPRFSDRSFDDLISIVFKDTTIFNLEHEIWDALENGSDR